MIISGLFKIFMTNEILSKLKSAKLKKQQVAKLKGLDINKQSFKSYSHLFCNAVTVVSNCQLINLSGYFS